MQSNTQLELASQQRVDHKHTHALPSNQGEILAGSWQDLFKAPARTANPLSRIYSFDGRHVASSPNW